MDWLTAIFSILLVAIKKLVEIIMSLFIILGSILFGTDHFQKENQQVVQTAELLSEQTKAIYDKTVEIFKSLNAQITFKLNGFEYKVKNLTGEIKVVTSGLYFKANVPIKDQDSINSLKQIIKSLSTPASSDIEKRLSLALQSGNGTNYELVNGYIRIEKGILTIYFSLL